MYLWCCRSKSKGLNRQRQNCTTPPDHWDFGMKLGWRLPIGIYPKFVQSQTPTNHPYSFLNHIVNSVPKRKKKGLWSIGKRNLNWKRNLLLKYWKSIRTLEVFEKVKVNVDICTTPNWTNPIWTNPHFDEQNGCSPKFLSPKWGYPNILKLATSICLVG